MGSKITINLLGEDQIVRRFERLEADAADMRPAWKDIRQLLITGGKQQFNTEGGHWSGGWQPLAPATVEFKRRHGYDVRILHRTGKLRRAAAGGVGSAFLSTADTMRYGITIPYAVYHQSNAPRKKIPQRKIVQLGEDDKRDIMKILQRQIIYGGA